VSSHSVGGPPTKYSPSCEVYANRGDLIMMPMNAWADTDGDPDPGVTNQAA